MGAGATLKVREEACVRAFRGVIHEGRVVLEPPARLPDGTVVTVTVGEGELLRATLRAAMRRNVRRRGRARRWAPVLTAGGRAT